MIGTAADKPAETASGRPLRVVLVDAWCMVPYYERYLYQALERRGIGVELATTDYSLNPGYFRQNGVPYRAPMLNVASRIPLIAARHRRWVKAIEYGMNLLGLTGRFLASKPDVVHIQWLPMLQTSGIEIEFLKLWKRRGIPLVYTVHNVLPHDTKDRHRRQYAKVYSMADALICHTHESRNQLMEEFGISASRLWHIPHGPLFHDLPRPSKTDARAQLGFKRDEFVVLWQGVVAPYKGLDLLLSAWKAVVQACPQARLVIAGTGKDAFLADIRRQVLDLALESSVKLDLRYIAVEELPAYFQAADTLALPYLAVTTSGALMTALTYGKPIVASDLPAFRENVTHEKSALLFPPGDANALAAALVRLVGDASLRNRLGAGAEQLQIQTMWDRIAATTEDCYRSLCPHRAAVTVAVPE